MSRLPVNEFMLIFRDLSKHAAVTKMSNNWSTLATIFSCASAWGMYWYLSHHHSSLESEIKAIQEKRIQIIEHRKKMLLTSEQSKQMLQSTDNQLSKELKKDYRIESVYTTVLLSVSAFSLSYLLGRYKGFRKAFVPTTSLPTPTSNTTTATTTGVVKQTHTFKILRPYSNDRHTN